MHVLKMMPCVGIMSCQGPRCQSAPCSFRNRSSKAAQLRPQHKQAGPKRLLEPCRALDSRQGDLAPSSSTSSGSQTFIHPELMEGPLEYLPSGWANHTPSSSSSYTPDCFYPSQSPSLQQHHEKGQWTGNWAHQEPSRSSMWNRQNSSSSWGPSSSSSPSPRGSLAPHDQNLLQTSLRNHLFRALSDQPAINLLEAGPHTLQRLTRVFGLVFRQPGHDQEGFYSLHAHAGGSENMACEIIMVFELQEEAERYACLLEAAMEPHHPRVFSIAAPLMVRFCREHGYECRMEPAGSLTVPPDCSVSLTDWERVKNLRNGSFLVLDDEPNAASSDHTSHKTSW